MQYKSARSNSAGRKEKKKERSTSHESGKSGSINSDIDKPKKRSKKKSDKSDNSEKSKALIEKPIEVEGPQRLQKATSGLKKIFRFISLGKYKTPLFF